MWKPMLDPQTEHSGGSQLFHFTTITHVSPKTVLTGPIWPSFSKAAARGPKRLTRHSPATAGWAASGENIRLEDGYLWSTLDQGTQLLIFSSPEYILRLRRRILITVLAAVGFLVFLAIVLSAEIIVADGENLSYFWLLICPTYSETLQGSVSKPMRHFGCRD
jgi:hypothetical protein